MAGNNKRKDFELGDEPVEVERRLRADVVISVRLSRDEADRLQAAARRANKTLSQTAREAITGCLESTTAPVGGSVQWTVGVSSGAPVYLKSRGGEMGAYTIGEGREVVGSLNG